MKKTARLTSESSAFDGRVLLGLDGLGLNPVWQRHEDKGSRAGVWLIGCEPEDDTVRYCTRCGAPGRVRSSWRRRFTHTPVGQHAVHLMVRVRRYECMPCAWSWTDDLTRVAPEGRRLTEAAVWWAAAEVVLKSKSILACARPALLMGRAQHGRAGKGHGDAEIGHAPGTGSPRPRSPTTAPCTRPARTPPSPARSSARSH